MDKPGAFYAPMVDEFGTPEEDLLQVSPDQRALDQSNQSAFGEFIYDTATDPMTYLGMGAAGVGAKAAGMALKHAPKALQFLGANAGGGVAAGALVENQDALFGGAAEAGQELLPVPPPLPADPRALQETLGVKVDGRIGPQTRKAAERYEANRQAVIDQNAQIVQMQQLQGQKDQAITEATKEEPGLLDQLPYGLGDTISTYAPYAAGGILGGTVAGGMSRAAASSRGKVAGGAEEIAKRMATRRGGGQARVEKDAGDINAFYGSGGGGTPYHSTTHTSVPRATQDQLFNQSGKDLATDATVLGVAGADYAGANYMAGEYERLADEAAARYKESGLTVDKKAEKDYRDQAGFYKGMQNVGTGLAAGYGVSRKLPQLGGRPSQKPSQAAMGTVEQRRLATDAAIKKMKEPKPVKAPRKAAEKAPEPAPPPAKELVPAGAPKKAQAAQEAAVRKEGYREVGNDLMEQITARLKAKKPIDDKWLKSLKKPEGMHAGTFGKIRNAAKDAAKEAKSPAQAAKLLDGKLSKQNMAITGGITASAAVRSLLPPEEDL